jgi:hypothetical protein
MAAKSGQSVGGLAARLQHYAPMGGRKKAGYYG